MDERSVEDLLSFINGGNGGTFKMSIFKKFDYNVLRLMSSLLDFFIG